MPRITLVGFYRWSDRKLFDAAVLPEAISRTVFVRLLLKNYGQLFPYQQDGDELILDISAWFESRLPYYNRLATAILADYNPIENYRRNEEHEGSGNSKTISTSTDSRTGKNTEQMDGSDSKNITGNASGTDKEKNGGQDSRVRELDTKKEDESSTSGTISRDTDSSSSGSETLSVSAYNSSGFNNREKRDTTATANEESNESNSSSGTSSGSEHADESITDSFGRVVDYTREGQHEENESGTLSRTSVLDSEMEGSTRGESSTENGNKATILAYGNIGVTTSQQMIKEEISLRKPLYSLYTIMMKEFEAEFLIRIY